MKEVWNPYRLDPNRWDDKLYIFIQEFTKKVDNIINKIEDKWKRN